MNPSLPPTAAPSPVPSPVEAAGARPRAGTFAARVLNHAVAALLAAVALFFTLWFMASNPAMARVFGYIFQPWAWGSDFDALGLAWAVIGVVLFTIVGWIYLEGLELYLPRVAALALAYLFGLGLSGFVFECLAIPYRLTRSWTAASLFVLILLLLGRAWLRGRRAPESGLGGGIEWREQVLRRMLARQAFAASLIRPAGFWSKVYCRLAAGLIGAITFFIFWHALLYPEVYWDSLILYLGYARQTFLAHGFPVKVTGQVGIGLGANYPHLYPVLGSGVTAMAGFWSELPQRLIAPLAGLATTLLIYHTTLRLTRHVGFALTIALLYRATPLGIIYDQYASDYALVLLFTAAFLYLALLYIQTGLRGTLSASALLIALAMHLNYLMGILWVPWGLTIVLAHTGAARRTIWRRDSEIAPWAVEAPWTVHDTRPPLLEFLGSRRFWGIVLVAAAVGSTWHVRNWIVTGNPVYAFFYKILGGKHVSDEVMQASAIEWGRNGAGIGSLGVTLGDRLRFTWGFFTGLLGFDRAGNPVLWRQYYQTAPLTMGFALGGLLVWLGLALAAPLGRRGRPMIWNATARFGLLPAVLFFGLLAFHYLLAPFYLYQIIGILPCLALLAALAWPYWRLPGWRLVLALLALAVGLVPGLANSMMGYKLVKVVSQPGQALRPGEMPDSQLNLFALRHPLPSAAMFYRWQYPEDAKIWEYVNANLKGQRLLTHENRDLPLDPSITIVNLDDWTDELNIQALWDPKFTPAERVRQLILTYHIHYYLFIPNELACPTNARLGTADWEKLGLATRIEIPGAGENKLYELKLPKE